MLQGKDNKGKITTLNLTGGELVQFDSQAMHQGTPLDCDRIGIGIWHTRIDLNDRNNWADD